MARVFIDCHMFSEAWFAHPLEELIKSPKVIFVFGLSKKHNEERSKVRKALEFYKLVGNLKSADGATRRIDTTAAELDPHEEFLSSQQCFDDCNHCDDPHIFALVYLKPTRYVFSKDARIAKCRSHINKTIDNKYCRFSIILNLALYNRHKQKILN